jgi:hypothetical protein
MVLLTDLYFSTENGTGLDEVRIIDVPVTDLNDFDDCQEKEGDCMKDIIYYFIFGEFISLFFTE